MFQIVQGGAELSDPVGGVVRVGTAALRAALLPSVIVLLRGPGNELEAEIVIRHH